MQGSVLHKRVDEINITNVNRAFAHHFMFDKLKQIQELKSLQNELKQQTYDIEKNGVRLVMNGGMEITELHLNPELSQQEQEQTIMQAYNELIRKVQMAMAQRFQGMM